ncbi:MAG: ABC transporter ATP-binding protein [Candidatus Dormiibacterota bacterium]
MPPPPDREPILPGPQAGTAQPLLVTRRLTKHFKLGSPLRPKLLHAVDQVDLVIGERQIVALVGESGSGKSTLARLLALIYPPTSGEIRFRGTPLTDLGSRPDLLRYRSQVPMVFQDPYSSLNPVFRVSHGVLRSLKLHRPELSRTERREEAKRLFSLVGLSPAAQLLRKFPHELSGGQRQRVGFAQALGCRPQLILADEPVSMLDVSIRIGLLNLILDLRQSEGVSFLYITHDIASARYVADRLVVMYAGKIVEQGPTEAVLRQPRHPYTQLLLAAVPDPRAEVQISASPELGEPPRVIDPTPGCRFRFRCPLAQEVCQQVDPELREMGPDHDAACHLAEGDRVIPAAFAVPTAV